MKHHSFFSDSTHGSDEDLGKAVNLGVPAITTRDVTGYCPSMRKKLKILSYITEIHEDLESMHDP